MVRRPRKATATPDQEAPAENPTLVVGIGASAGGVRALQAFFEALPPEPGAAFVVIVHLDPSARSELPEILAAKAKMPAQAVTGTSELRPNCIYVIPPDRQLRMSDGQISATPFDEPRGLRAPIDHFFRSLASQHEDGFAVILTGAGSDGAVGVKAVKEAGGIILVQDPDEAEYPSMPRASIATDVADFILPVQVLAERLVELIKLKEKGYSGPGREEVLRRILAHLRVRTGHDFTRYKKSTIGRRVQRRMQLARKERLEDYFAYLRDNAPEAQLLLADLLVSVTTFFRDPKAFDALATQVIPRIFDDSPDGSAIRVWVPGCATGEEAYSVAMLLLEEASRREKSHEIQLFGSDLDSRALAIAREGRYPTAIEADVSEDRLRRHFSREGDHYRVRRELRDVVLFANHSVLRDPPFSRLDLVSCRNLLIYLDRELQQEILGALHYGLKPRGYLLLGSSENADHPNTLFRVVDRDGRLYQSSAQPGHPLPSLEGLAVAHGQPLSVQQPSAPDTAPKNALTAHRVALETSAPPSVLVDAVHRVVHLSESAGRYLQPSAGPLTNDIIDLVREELRFELRTALNRAFEHREIVLTGPVAVRFNGSPHRIHVQVRPTTDGRAGQRALVVFLEGEAFETAEGEARGGVDGADQTAARLRQDLEFAQARLRTSHEQSEAANEELRAANEELQSINEEYRSTAEELETSKEELQSINEELQTVNSELKLKLESVSRANSDLQNLMAATDFGTLFLDPALRIKRFTPPLTGLFSVNPSDVGRPITDFAHQLEYGGLAADATRVIETLTPIQRELRSQEGGWFLVRFRPYRTVEDKIDGVVVTFVDITERRRTEDALRASEEHLRQQLRLVELSHEPILIWDFDDGILQWNRGSEALFGYTAEEAIGVPTHELLRTRVPGSSFEAVREALLAEGVWRGDLTQTAKDGREILTEAQIELVAESSSRYVLESARDVTETRALIARQSLLLNELTHRVRNTLTVVQSMVHQTWRTAGSTEDFVERIDGRIAALANAHKLLVDSDWAGADLRTVIETQLAPYLGEEAERVHLEGGSVTLPPDVASPLGLVIHELATNAVKHGALSNSHGTIRLNWRLDGQEGAPILHLAWTEHDGPPVKTPATRGLGSHLIRQGVPGAKIKHSFHAEGVAFEIDAPLSEAH
jgi:two-component system CheB/CheR fusion protein